MIRPWLDEGASGLGAKAPTQHGKGGKYDPRYHSEKRKSATIIMLQEETYIQINFKNLKQLKHQLQWKRKEQTNA